MFGQFVDNTSNQFISITKKNKNNTAQYYKIV